MAAAKLDRDLPAAGKRFIELNRQCPLYPIGSAAELDRAIAAIDRLLDEDELSAEEDAYLTVLGRLVHDYEEEHEPMDDVSPGQMLAFLIEQKGVTQAAVAAATGASPATISQILKANRKPGRKLMAALAAYFKVDPAVFL